VQTNKPDVLDVLLYVFENYTEEVELSAAEISAAQVAPWQWRGQDEPSDSDDKNLDANFSREEHVPAMGAPPNPDLDIVALNDELSRAGFPEPIVAKAVTWLGELCQQQRALRESEPQEERPTIRIYSPAEWLRLGEDGVAFLNDLDFDDILSTRQRELVIERVMALDVDEVQLDQLEWLVLLVLCNQPAQAQAYDRLEALMYSDEYVSIH